MIPDTKILKTKVIEFDGDLYRITKAEVNVRNNSKSIKVFIKKIGEGADEARNSMDM